MEKVFLGLGGNVGNVSMAFDISIENIETKIGKVINKSKRYKTEPWGIKNQENFLNMVLEIETELTPDEILLQIIDIEKKMGRYRDKENQFGPRTIDIDILFYGKKIIRNNKLIIPHPRLHLRNFVLTPLKDIAPELVHPVLKKSIKTLLKELPDNSKVEKA
jgi:2-amino-4-hydroxy-6-hydroxymethyldihydropteridine diphosphokinase